VIKAAALAACLAFLRHAGRVSGSGPFALSVTATGTAVVAFAAWLVVVQSNEAFRHARPGFAVWLWCAGAVLAVAAVVAVGIARAAIRRREWIDIAGQPD
jgi:uncharacterized membrane protein YdcZ (DUF606 family)